LDVTCSRHDIGEKFIIGVKQQSLTGCNREQVTSNEWLLLNAKWWIVYLYHGETKLHPMSDCCLKPIMNFSPISWREQVTSNEWLLFNAKWWIVHLYHGENKLHPMSDCCLKPNDQLFSSFGFKQQSLIGCNLFSPWYRWTIHHLALNNNHSLDVTCSRHDIGEQFIIWL
jgi:ribosomal silencing factor RsfS